jgi:hypothetical protein
MPEPFKWFVNCNFTVMATTEAEAIQKVKAVLEGHELLGYTAIEGWYLTHATEEGEGG